MGAAKRRRVSKNHLLPRERLHTKAPTSRNCPHQAVARLVVCVYVKPTPEMPDVSSTVAQVSVLSSMGGLLTLCGACCHSKYGGARGAAHRAGAFYQTNKQGMDHK